MFSFNEKPLTDIVNEYGFSGKGNIDRLGVEKYDMEGDFFIKDFTDNENLIKRVEENDEISGYTEEFDKTSKNEKYLETLKKLEINLDDIDNVFGFILLNEPMTEILAAGYMFYSSKFIDVGMKANTYEINIKE